VGKKKSLIDNRSAWGTETACTPPSHNVMIHASILKIPQLTRTTMGAWSPVLPAPQTERILVMRSIMTRKMENIITYLDEVRGSSQGHESLD
jgi:hypothetical protein